MAKTMVIENSRNSLPGMPGRKISGMKAAASDRLIETTVKPICRAPSNAAATGRLPISMLR